MKTKMTFFKQAVFFFILSFVIAGCTSSSSDCNMAFGPSQNPVPDPDPGPRVVITNRVITDNGGEGLAGVNIYLVDGAGNYIDLNGNVVDGNHRVLLGTTDANGNFTFEVPGFPNTEIGLEFEKEGYIINNSPIHIDEDSAPHYDGPVLATVKPIPKIYTTVEGRVVDDEDRTTPIAGVNVYLVDGAGNYIDLDGNVVDEAHRLLLDITNGDGEFSANVPAIPNTDISLKFEKEDYTIDNLDIHVDGDGVAQYSSDDIPAKMVLKKVVGKVRNEVLGKTDELSVPVKDVDIYLVNEIGEYIDRHGNVVDEANRLHLGKTSSGTGIFELEVPAKCNTTIGLKFEKNNYNYIIDNLLVEIDSDGKAVSDNYIVSAILPASAKGVEFSSKTVFGSVGEGNYIIFNKEKTVMFVAGADPVSGYSRGTIFRIDMSTGVKTPILSSTGQVKGTTIYGPRGLALTDDGTTLYVGEWYGYAPSNNDRATQCKIYKITNVDGDPSNYNVYTIAGALKVDASPDAEQKNDIAGNKARFNGIAEMALSKDENTLYVSNPYGGCIRKVTNVKNAESSDITQVSIFAGEWRANSAPPTPTAALATSNCKASEARFYCPFPMVLSSDKNTIYMSDTHNIRKITNIASSNPNDIMVYTLAGGYPSLDHDDVYKTDPENYKAGNIATFCSAYGLALSTDEDVLFIADGSNRIDAQVKANNVKRMEGIKNAEVLNPTTPSMATLVNIVLGKAANTGNGTTNNYYTPDGQTGDADTIEDITFRYPSALLLTTNDQKLYIMDRLGYAIRVFIPREPGEAGPLASNLPNYP